jgi:putative membrane protein
MRVLTFLAWLLGAALFAWLLASNHFGAVFAAVQRLHGWLAIIILFHAAPLFCDVTAWRLVFVRAPPRFRLFIIRWIGEAANGLLPVPHLGELLRVKLAYEAGSDLVDAGSSVLADITIGLVTQVLFTVAGLVLLGLGRGADATVRSLAIAAVLTSFVVCFYGAQRTRLFSRAAQALNRSTGSAWRLFDGAAVRRVEDALQAVYARRRVVTAALLWRLAGWVLGAGEIWLIPFCLGRPIGVADAIILESLSQGARAAAFVIPGGLGVQDGALMALTAELGLGAELGLVIALVKRCRELALGLPALALAWAGEIRRWRRRSPA